MRQLTVGIALFVALIGGGIVLAGTAHADATVRMYVDQTGYAGCAVGVGYDSYADTYCVD